MPAIDELSFVEQGVVLAALLDGHDDPPALSRIADPVGARCREVFAGLRELDPDHRRRAVEAMTRRLFSPVPANLERVHPSWVQELLEREPAPVIRVVSQVLPPGLLELLVLPALPEAPVRIPSSLQGQILRAVLGRLAPMPPAPPPDVADAPLERPEELLGWELERLEQTLVRAGCLTLAALVRGEEALQARVITSLSPPHDELLRLALGRPNALPPVRVLPRIAMPPLAGGSRADRMLAGLACQLLAAALPPTVGRQLAQRLPRELGLPLVDPPANPETERLNEQEAAVRQLLLVAESWGGPT